MPPKDSSDLYKWLALGAVGLISVTVGVLSVSGWKLGGSWGQAQGSRAWPFAAASKRFTLSPPGQPGAARPAPEVLELSDLDKLLSLFAEAERTGPATSQAFKKEFMKQPELREAWEDFTHGKRQPDGTGQTIDDLAETLVRKPAFRQLLQSFAQDAGFHQIAAVVSRDPVAQSAVRRMMAAAAAQGAAQGRTRAAARGGMSAFSLGTGAAASRGGATASGAQSSSADAVTSRAQTSSGGAAGGAGAAGGL